MEGEAFKAGLADVPLVPSILSAEVAVAWIAQIQEGLVARL